MSHSSPASTRGWLTAGVLLTVTLVLTLSRAWRWPNDFAEAHWLLDYRFGFVKRGLAGQLLSSTLGLAGTEPTAAIISTIAVGLLVALSVALLWTASQIIQSSSHPGAAVLASLAFLSSPFIVMSAHVIGYLDGSLMLLTIAAIALTLRGRLWTAGIVQALAILVHESAVLVGFPILCLAWWVTAPPRHERRDQLRRAVPLLLPIVAFAALALSARALPADFENRYSQHLMRYAFVQGDMHIFVPEWLTPGFAQHVAEQKHRFVQRLTSGPMLGLVLPTVLALLAWIIAACRVRPLSVTMALLAGATFAPQLMHIAAWDTMRIWTYSAAMAWLGAWTLTRATGAPGDVSAGVRVLALLALLVNVTETTFLLDNLADHYALTTRLVLFAPVLCGALIIAARIGRPS